MEPHTITSLLTLSSILIGFGVQIYRENRNRRWDIEDRRQVAEKLERDRLLVHSAAKELKTMISENTKISTDAFHEANTVNIKLEKLGLQHNEQGAEQTAAVKKLSEILNKREPQ
jgi:hypothetical protein